MSLRAAGTARVNGTSSSPPVATLQGVGDFAEALQALLGSPVAKNVAAMAKNYTDLETTNRKNFESICQVQKENKDLQKTCRQRDDELADAKKKIKELLASQKKERQAWETEREEKNKAIEAMKKKFQANSERLELLESFALKPKTMEKDEITKSLDDIFTSAHTFVQSFLGQDLPDEAFASHNWKRLKDSVPGLPLPPSNSADAKRMRVAAVLGCLGQAATRELFQPVYVLPSGDEISYLLGGMEDAKQADWLRRSLLNTDRDRQEGNALARAKAVASDVSRAIAGILAQPDENRFDAALKTWCTTTATVWRQQLQPLECDLFAELHDETSLVAWAPLLPTAAWRTANDEVSALHAVDHIAARVWPVFATSTMVVVKKGLAATKAQVLRAAEEERQAATMPANSRRATRIRARTMSLTVMTDAAPGASGPSSPFLASKSPLVTTTASNGGGGGSSSGGGEAKAADGTSGAKKKPS
ncbi:hypothetical protein SPI_03806 [Niveomyces insectorum RCEF 264]|uniref:MEI5 protein n=1 Tax=Niveomyces insectorum RCEF 264 TaxID=1081102 RepID=A0A167WDD9_9HYPO|nr:hypothetical protein SPI_03806 [Niveomyces insectorum RCEF 264]